MPEPISAGAIENPVEGAEALQTPQLVDAEPQKTPVDSNEPIEQSSDEPDMMTLLLGEDTEPVVDETGKVVPEGQFLKLKDKNRTMKQELDRLRSQITQPVPTQTQQVQAPVQTVAEPPSPDKYDDGVYDTAFQTALMQYQKDEIAKVIQENMVKTNVQMETNAYLSKYQERLERVLPIANQRIDELKQKDSGFKQRLESPSFQQALANLPAEAKAAIAESNSPESLLNYYTQKPERFNDLTKNSVDELLNLGTLIGKVNGVKGTRKSVSTQVKPIKSGDNTSKLHPINDYHKYDHATTAGHRKWELALEKHNTRS